MFRPVGAAATPELGQIGLPLRAELVLRPFFGVASLAQNDVCHRRLYRRIKAQDDGFFKEAFTYGAGMMSSAGGALIFQGRDSKWMEAGRAWRKGSRSPDWKGRPMVKRGGWFQMKESSR